MNRNRLNGNRLNGVFAGMGNVLTAGTISFSAVGTTGLVVSSTPATGGVAPYLYQFRRAPDQSGSPGTFANVGPNSAALSFTDSGLSPNTTYWYECTVTDNS